MHAAGDGVIASQIVAGLFEAAAVLDARDRPVVANDFYRQLVGLNARRLQKAVESGTTTFDLVNSPGPELRDGLMQCRDTRRPVRLVELVAKNQQGESFSLWVSFIPMLAPDGQLEAVIVVMRDVTAEVRVQEHFRQLLKESQGRAEELERVVQERTQELQRALAQVTMLSRTDPLTGALNRRAFSDNAEQAIGLARRHPERGLGILMCDLDHFKRVNDTYGHGAGDAMLSATAKALSHVVRTVDRLARFGGEEFVVLLPEVTPEGLSLVGERCCAAIRSMPFAEIVPGMTSPQTISIGGACFPMHGETVDALLQAADEALYKAKQGGRNQYCSAPS